jgi:hypothetical protein
MARFKYTPDPTKGDVSLVLETNEVFVFGANQEGKHLGGAAYAALHYFGAIYGEIHRTGRTYGLVTLYAPTSMNANDPQRITQEELEAEFKLFFTQALLESEKTFYLTRVGLGIGGWQLEDVLKAFHKHYIPSLHTNIVLPGAEWELVKNEAPTEVFSEEKLSVGDQVLKILKENNQNPDEERYGKQTIMFFGQEEGNDDDGVSRIVEKLTELVEVQHDAPGIEMWSGGFRKTSKNNF